LSADKKKEKCPEPIPTGNFIFSASGIVLFFGAMLGSCQSFFSLRWHLPKNQMDVIQIYVENSLTLVRLWPKALWFCGFVVLWFCGSEPQRLAIRWKKVGVQSKIKNDKKRKNRLLLPTIFSLCWHRGHATPAPPHTHSINNSSSSTTPPAGTITLTTALVVRRRQYINVPPSRRFSGQVCFRG